MKRRPIKNKKAIPQFGGKVKVYAHYFKNPTALIQERSKTHVVGFVVGYKASTLWGCNGFGPCEMTTHVFFQTGNLPLRPPTPACLLHSNPYPSLACPCC
jgi:hypothetical protein